MAFYAATSKINFITKSITEFLEKTPMKEFDKDNKIYHTWNFLHTEIEYDYNKSEGKVFWVDSDKTHIYIKISKDYELVMSLNWTKSDWTKSELKQTLKDYKIYVREDSKDWNEREYPSYFKSSFIDDASNSGINSILTELREAISMKKDDWKRKEVL
jgi:hypothetical protein